MPVVTYSLLRLGLFLLALGGLWLAGMGSWLLVVVAAVVAAALSYVIFGEQRMAAGRWIEDRRATAEQGPRFSRAVQDDAEVEDAIADRLHAPEPADEPEDRFEGQADGGATDEHEDTDEPEDTDGRPGGRSGRGDQTASPSPSSTP